jgi:hypothetical protein
MGRIDSGVSASELECKGQAGGDPKRIEEDTAVWQGKKKEILRQRSRLQEKVPGAPNAKASLEEIHKRSLRRSKTSVWQREGRDWSLAARGKR